MSATARVLAAGFTFTESPRWHDGRLWFLDYVSESLWTVDLEGNAEEIEKFSERPSAIDFLPDGAALVALSQSKQIVRLEDRSVYADLSSLTNGGRPFQRITDMVIDAHGRLYVDCNMPGHDPERPMEDVGDALALVTPDGGVRIAATGVFNNNGLAIVPDGRTLLVAEPLRRAVAAYAIADGGALSDRRVFADLGDNMPDGICADADGAVWAAGVFTGEVVRADRDGRITDRVMAAGGHWPMAVMLGGPSGRHLFITTCKNEDLFSWEAIVQGAAFIEVVEVDVPGGGWPGNGTSR